MTLAAEDRLLKT